MIIQQIFLKALAAAAGPEWTGLGQIGSANTTTNGASTGTVTITSNQALAVGSVVVMTAFMQISATPTFGSCVDSAGNTWNLISNSNGMALYYSKLSTAMTTSSTIAINVTNHSGSFGVLSGTAWAFTIPSGKTVNKITTPISSSSTTATDSLSLSGLTSREYLFFRFEVVSNTGTGFPVTATSGWTLGKYSKLSTSAEGEYGEYLVSTGTGATSDPSGIGGTNNSRYVFTALYLT